MFIKDELSFLKLPSIHHTLYDTDFTEVIELEDHGVPYTTGYLNKFIATYESKGMNPVPNVIKFITQEILYDWNVCFQHIINNYPHYADEMRKYIMLI